MFSESCEDVERSGHLSQAAMSTTLEEILKMNDTGQNHSCEKDIIIRDIINIEINTVRRTVED